MSDLLEIESLTVSLPVAGQQRPVLHDVSLRIGEGEAVGLVGESGSGKSMTARAVARLLPKGAQLGGRIAFAGEQVLDLRGAKLREYRTEGVAMIFQDPRAHTNPVRTIGDFLTEAMCTNLGMRPRAAQARALTLLESVGIDNPQRRLKQYPHQLSGGMLQRVMIASAIAVRPRLILADEPTTALDVTTQAEVMAILDNLRREHGLAMLFITHDLELAGAVCDRTAVMYAGSIVEEQASARLHDDPLHPYTAALVEARPSVTVTAHRLAAVPGRPVSAFEAPAGCAFAPRCPHVQDACRTTTLELARVDSGLTRCLRIDELRGELARSQDGSVA
ncbi:ABC transporter ATP-binding protein [Angustibacter sp. McL0619]|uniref:ABC transporter ATP-binding protein n=1 Tax=Angustibacter sp. McL0619 TaxID=3415676 RepID=UPI003CF407F7